MPTYDYICDSCGHEFEAFEPITSQPRTDCPECKVPKLRRKIGPGAAILFVALGFNLLGDGLRDLYDVENVR